MRQSNASIALCCLLGTTSMAFANPFNNADLTPSQEIYYNYQVNQEQYNKTQESGKYLLKHEVMYNYQEITEIETILEIPTVKSIQVKFNKPTQLEFTCVENSKGFIE